MIGQSSQKKALRLESEERLVFGDNTGRIGKVAEKERGAAVEHRAGFTAELAEGVFDQLKLIADGNGTETEQKAIAENRLLIEERFGIEVAAEGLLQAQTGGGRLTRLLKTEPCDDKARTGGRGQHIAAADRVPARPDRRRNRRELRR